MAEQRIHEEPVYQRDYYEFDESKSMSFKELYDKHRYDFPLMVIVTEGDIGTCVYDEFPSDTILRMHDFTIQRRVIVRRTVGGSFEPFTYYSIPVDINYKFCVVRDQKKGSPQNLSEIISKSATLPVEVEFAPKEQFVQIEHDMKKTSEFGTLSLMAEYEEAFMCGNTVESGKLLVLSSDSTGFARPNQKTMILIACTKEVTCSIITGLTQRPKEDFVEHTKQFDNYITKYKIGIKKGTGNPGITVMTKTGTGSGNALPEVAVQFFHKSPPPAPPRPYKPHKLRRAAIIRETNQIPASRETSNEQEEADGDNVYTSIPADTEIYEQVSDRSDENTEHVPINPRTPRKKSLGNENRNELSEKSFSTCHDPISSQDLPLSQDKRATGKATKSHSGDSGERYVSLSKVGKDSKKYQALKPDIKEPEPFKQDTQDDLTHIALVKSLSVAEVGKQLTTLKLKHHVKQFNKKMVDGEILCELNKDALTEEFHFLPSEAIRLLKFIKTGHIPK